MPLQLDHLRHALDQPNNSPEASRDEVRIAFEITVRSANPSDAASVAACVNAAFSLYIERIGKPPGAMLADYQSLRQTGFGWRKLTPKSSVCWFNSKHAFSIASNCDRHTPQKMLSNPLIDRTTMLGDQRLGNWRGDA